MDLPFTISKKESNETLSISDLNFAYICVSMQNVVEFHQNHVNVI